MSKKPKSIITGTGRCGTGYTAELLQHLGFRAGHEAYYNPLDSRREDLQVDVSWLAMPEIDFMTPSALQLRHPMKVINSLVGIQFFTSLEHGPYRAFAYQNCPALNHNEDDLTNAMRWVYWWNTKPKVKLTYRVEDLDDPNTVAALLDVLGLHSRDPEEIQDALARIEPTINHRPRADLTWADLPEGWDKARIELFCHSWKYDPEDLT